MYASFCCFQVLTNPLFYATISIVRGRGGMADTPDLGSGVLRRAGSSPVARTSRQCTDQLRVLCCRFFLFVELSPFVMVIRIEKCAFNQKV